MANEIAKEYLKELLLENSENGKLTDSANSLFENDITTPLTIQEIIEDLELTEIDLPTGDIDSEGNPIIEPYYVAKEEDDELEINADILPTGEKQKPLQMFIPDDVIAALSNLAGVSKAGDDENKLKEAQKKLNRYLELFIVKGIKLDYGVKEFIRY